MTATLFIFVNKVDKTIAANPQVTSHSYYSPTDQEDDELSFFEFEYAADEETDLLLVQLSYRSPNSHVASTVGFDSEELTHKCNSQPGAGANEYVTELWYMTSPPTGADYYLYVEFEGEIQDLVVGVADITEVDSVNPFDYSSCIESYNAEQKPEMAFETIEEGQLAFAGFTTYKGGVDYLFDGQTGQELWNGQSRRNNTLSVGGVEPASVEGGSVTIGWTATGEHVWSGVGVVINAPSSSPDTEGKIYILGRDTTLYEATPQGDLTYVDYDYSGAQEGYEMACAIAANPQDKKLYLALKILEQDMIRFLRITPSTGQTEVLGTLDAMGCIYSLVFDDSGNLYGTYWDDDWDYNLFPSTIYQIDPVLGEIDQIATIENETYQWGNSLAFNTDNQLFYYATGERYSHNQLWYEINPNNNWSAVDRQFDGDRIESVEGLAYRGSNSFYALGTEYPGSYILYGVSSLGLFQGIVNLQFGQYESPAGLAFMPATEGIPEDPDEQSPEIDFVLYPFAYTKSSFLVTGVAQDNQTITNVEYSVDFQEAQVATPDDGDFNSGSENFTISITGLTAGEHILTVWATDAAENTSEEYLFEFIVDDQEPVCSMSSFSADPTQDTVFSYTAECEDDVAIMGAAYQIYHTAGGGFLYDGVYFWEDGTCDADTCWNEISDPSLGDWGDAELTLDFNTKDLWDFVRVDEQPLEGNYLITLKVYDSAGNYADAGTMAPVDKVVLEYLDNTPPSVYISHILPNPTSNSAPIVTGFCADRDRSDTNSDILSIDYRLKNKDTLFTGPWTSVESVDSQFDSSVEYYEITLDVLEPANYALEVRCQDTSGNSTDDDDTNALEEFSVIEHNPEYPAEKIIFTEDFDSGANRASHETDAIWGNGVLRAREKIGFTQTLIDGENFTERYNRTDNQSVYRLASSSRDGFWYSKKQDLFFYSPSSDTIDLYDFNSRFGIENAVTVHDLVEGVYQNKVFLWIATDSGLVIYNADDDEYKVFSLQINKIALDYNRDRMGAYLLKSDGSVEYLDIGQDLNPSVIDDDQTNNQLALPESGIINIHLDSASDRLYVSKYLDSLAYLDDNRTPLNNSDDDFVSLAGIKYGSYFSMESGDDGNVFLGNPEVYNAHLGLIQGDITELSVFELANIDDLRFENPWSLAYVSDQTGVGSQLFIGTNDQLIYLNMNNTYTDTSDDTLLFLNLNSGMYPVNIKDILVYDYDTVFVIKSNGLYRVDLERDWEETNSAVTYVRPAADHLLIDNFVLDEVKYLDHFPATIANLNSSSWTSTFANLLVPEVKAQGSATTIFYVSLDDGLTWEQIEEGEIKKYSEQDCRAKFKIEILPSEGQTPVIDSYRVGFAAYSSEAQKEISGFEIQVNPSASKINTNFSINVEAVDALGNLVTDYSSSITLSLYEYASNNVTTGLNLSGLEIVNGIGHSDTIKIDKTGDFYIRVEKEGMVANSGKITITPESPPSDTQDSNSNSDDDSGSNESSGSGDGESSSVVYPWVSFYANSYSIYPGQEATLYWETNTSRVRIEPDIGTVSATGLIKVRPLTTTIYKIYASIDNLEVSSALTVKVLSDKENGKSAEEQNGSDSSEGGRSKPIFVDVNDGKIVVKKGEKVKIYWKVDNSERVYVDYLDKDLSSEGYFEFFPQEDVKITLTASNEYGTAKKEIRVVVKNAPFSFISLFTFRWLIAILSIFLLFFLFLFLKRREKGNQEQRLRIKKTKN